MENKYDVGSTQNSMPWEENDSPGRLSEHLWSAWQDTKDEIAELAEEEDRKIEAGAEISPEFDEEVDALYAQQRKIILDALSIRAETLKDICLKLELWQSHTYGDKVKPHLLQPSDLLIRQTIRELAELNKTL